MAIELERDFVRRNIVGHSVFEFGCGNGLFAEELSHLYSVTAIDLFVPQYASGYEFIHGDVRYTKIDKTYDTVISVSSLEHSGVETGQCNNPDYEAIEQVSKILSSIAYNRIIITAPFGDGKYLFNGKTQFDKQYDEVTNPEWGYRLLNNKIIEELFPEFNITDFTVLTFSEGDFFDCTKWTELGMTDFISEHKQIMMCVLDRK